MGDYTLNECKGAVRACEKLADQAQSRAMRNYWQELGDMWQGRARDAEKLSLQQMRFKEYCPEPVALGGDEYKCPACKRFWGRDETRPTCERKQEQ